MFAADTGASLEAQRTPAIEGCTSKPCLFRCALDAVTVPLFMQEHDTLLYANRAAVVAMGGSGDEPVTGRPVNDFIHPDSADASEQRRRLALQHGASLRGVPIKGRTLDGTVSRAIADGERIGDSAGRVALMHVLREAGGKRFLSFNAPARTPGDAASSAASCLHEAAFEAAPIPLAIHDAGRFIAVNDQARRLIGGDAKGLAPNALTHSDSVDAGNERRGISLGHGHAMKDIHVKLQGLDGRTLYVALDATPFDHDGNTALVLTVREARD